MRWTPSTKCNQNQCCVLVASVDGEIWVRDSKLGDASPVLKFTPADWEEFRRHVDADDMGNYLGPVIWTRFDDDWWLMAHRDDLKTELCFDDGEAEAFLDGLIAGEFAPEVLAAMDGPGGDAPKGPSGATLADAGGDPLPV